MKKLVAILLVLAVITVPGSALLVPKTDVLYTAQDPVQALAELAQQIPMSFSDNTEDGITMAHVKALAEVINIFSKELLTEVIGKLNAHTGGKISYSFTDYMGDVLGLTQYPRIGNKGNITVLIAADEPLVKETIAHEFTHLFHAYFYYEGLETQIHDTCVAENNGEQYMKDFLNDPTKKPVEWTFYQKALFEKTGYNYFIEEYAQTSEYEDLATIVAEVGYTPVLAKTIFLQEEKESILHKYEYFMSLWNTHFQTAAQSPLYQFNQLDHVAAPWAEESIRYGLDKGIILPYMNHSFESDMTRIDFCKAVVTALDGAVERNLMTEALQMGPRDVFSDTKDAYVIAAYYLGIVSGTGDGGFRPEGNITRQEAAKMLTAAMQLLKEVQGTDMGYADAEQIAPWAVESVNAAGAAGVMTGTGEGFEPLRTYSRQQAFVSIVRMYDYLKAA